MWFVCDSYSIGSSEYQFLASLTSRHPPNECIRCNCNWVSELATWRSNCLRRTWPYAEYVNKRMNVEKWFCACTSHHHKTNNRGNHVRIRICRPLKAGSISIEFQVLVFLVVREKIKILSHIFSILEYFFHVSPIAIGFINFFLLSRSRYSHSFVRHV